MVHRRQTKHVGLPFHPLPHHPAKPADPPGALPSMKSAAMNKAGRRNVRLLSRFVSMTTFLVIALWDIFVQPPQSYDGNGNKLLVDKKRHGEVKVYAPTSSASNVAICTIVKNETLYLDEWVDYHIALGFSPIYIYDNSPG